MTITITDHSVQGGDMMHIAYRLTEPEKFKGVACIDRVGREYARSYTPASEGVIQFQVAHGRSICVRLHAWHLGGSFVQSDFIDVHVPYPLDVDAVRAIVRSELEAAETAHNERRAAMMAGICAGLPVNAFVNYGDEPEPDDTVKLDEVVERLRTELHRQAEEPLSTQYVSPGLSDSIMLDGTFDLRALAKAVINPRNPTT